MYLNNLGKQLANEAAKFDNNAKVSELIAARADINYQDHVQATPLMRAALNGNPDNLKVLIKAGADVNYCDRFNRGALFEALKGWADVNGNEPAYVYKYYHCVQALINARANILITDTLCGVTPLRIAACSKNPAIAELLVKRLHRFPSKKHKQKMIIAFIGCRTKRATGPCHLREMPKDIARLIGQYMWEVRDLEHMIKFEDSEAFNEVEKMPDQSKMKKLLTEAYGSISEAAPEPTSYYASILSAAYNFILGSLQRVVALARYSGL